MRPAALRAAWRRAARSALRRVPRRFASRRIFVTGYCTCTTVRIYYLMIINCLTRTVLYLFALSSVFVSDVSMKIVRTVDVRKILYLISNSSYSLLVLSHGILIVKLHVLTAVRYIISYGLRYENCTMQLLP